MNERELLQFWGKAGKETDPARIHPAMFHMIDVGMSARVLVERSPNVALRGLSLAAGVEPSQLGRVVGFLIALHDLGKISPGFQNKRSDLVAALDAENYPFPDTTDPDHSRVSQVHLIDRSAGKGPRYRTFVDGVRSIAAHHGSFHPVDVDGMRNIHGARRWVEARDAAIERLGQVFEVDPIAALSALSCSPADAMILAGLTALADWIGSDEGHFPRAGAFSGDIKAYARDCYSKAKRAISKLGWDPWEPDGHTWTFERIFPTMQPNGLQQLTAALGNEATEPSLFIIEAPMGLGKTEAGLHLADLLMNRFGHRGLYYALPTQATSNQLFRRTADMYLCPRLQGNRANVHLLHRLAPFNDEYAALLDAKDDMALPQPTGIGDVDEVSLANAVRASWWFRGRKLGLLSPFAVGTVDQALMGVLQTKHMFVRLYGLAGKVVLIDEAHAYDIYTSTLLEQLVRWLAALRCSVIVLSATLPETKRRVLLQAYAGERTEAESQEEYPRLTVATLGGAVREFPIPGAPDKTVQFERLSPPLEEDRSEWVASVLAAELNGGCRGDKETRCAAWICNSVEAAQRAYVALKGRRDMDECELVLYHARFPVQDRQKTEALIESKFGKESYKSGERPWKAVLIGTQVLEQALDYSVDLMVTELAPIDLLLQRSGRMHRHELTHGWTRPANLRQPRVIWLSPMLNDAGMPDFGVSGLIYNPVVLLRSWQALERGAVPVPQVADGSAGGGGVTSTPVALPKDIERLVESVYGEDRPILTAEFLDLEANLEREGQIAETQDGRKAAGNALRDPDEDDPFRMDRMLSDDEDPAVNIHGIPGTRLAEPNVTIICAHRSGDQIVFSEDNSALVPLEREPDRDEVKALLRRAVRLQVKHWFYEIVKWDVPAGWRKTPLADYRVWDGVTRREGNYVLSLHKKIGLITSSAVLEKADELGALE